MKVSRHTAVICALEVDQRDQDAAEGAGATQVQDTYLGRRRVSVNE